jgi:tetratricopeptide (TPR) repeat protein
VRPAAWLLTAALVAAPLGVARAYRIASPPPPPPPPADFWSEALHPNSQRVAELVMQLEAMLRQLDDPYGATDRTRIEMVREGNRLARQARQLDPDDLDALYFSGAFADAAGRALDAERVLTEYTRRAALEARRADALVRLGRIALRQGRVDEAVAQLRQASAQFSDRFTMVRSRIALAHALEAQGDIGAAVATLIALTEALPLDGDPASVAAHVALAVIYDRDEQLTAAFDVLLRLRTAMDSEYVRLADDALRAFPPPLAIDLHYYRALVYETWPYLTAEAARAWRAYEVGGAPTGLAARAGEHRRLLELELARARPKPKRPK